MSGRPLPPELVAVLRRAAAVEQAAQGREQRRAAAAATTRLLVACLDVGWKLSEVASPAGLTPSTAQKRAADARAAGLDGVGLEVPPAPRRVRRWDGALSPVEEREWLTVGEAAATAGVDRSTIERWQSVGVLPNSRRMSSVQTLYLRADVLRVMRQPRSRNGGISLQQLRAQLQSP